MSNIYSNLFTLDKDEYIEEIINIAPEEGKKIEYTSISDEFKEKCLSILKTCKGYEHKKFIEINVDFDNFSEHHYDIMKHRLIIITYDKDTEKYKYLTPDGKVYISSDPKVISIIHMVPKPFKISFDFVPRVEYEKITSFLMLSKVLYKINSSNLELILKEFLKPTIVIDNTSEYALLYYLFNIYPKIEAIITNYKYWRYVNLEQYIFELSYKINEINSFVPIEKIEEDIIDLNSKISCLLNKLNIDYKEPVTEEVVLQGLLNKTEIYPTLDPYILHLLNEEDIITLKGYLDRLYILNNIKDIRNLSKINTCNEYGLIGANNLLNQNIYSDKILIRGSYEDMYFKLMAHCTYNKSLISTIKEDNKLIESLLYDEDIDNKALTSHLIETYIKARLNNCSTDEEFIDFFHKTINTIILKDDLEYLDDIYSKHLDMLDKAINHYNNNQYLNEQPKILSNDSSYINKNILDKQNAIMKTLLKEIDMYCNDFNIKNKDKMNICYFDNNNIYICADKGAFNTAFDTLTRIMPQIFSRFCKSVPSTCYIKVIE